MHALDSGMRAISNGHGRGSAAAESATTATASAKSGRIIDRSAAREVRGLFLAGGGFDDGELELRRGLGLVELAEQQLERAASRQARGRAAGRRKRDSRQREPVD